MQGPEGRLCFKAETCPCAVGLPCRKGARVTPGRELRPGPGSGHSGGCVGRGLASSSAITALGRLLCLEQWCWRGQAGLAALLKAGGLLLWCCWPLKAPFCTEMFLVRMMKTEDAFCRSLDACLCNGRCPLNSVCCRCVKARCSSKRLSWKKYP